MKTMLRRTTLLASAVLFCSFFAFGQVPGTPTKVDDWFLRDAETDSVQGVSAERAYQTILKGRPSRTIIVAVVDSGIDIDHEDLKNVIWTNEDEIPGNEIDDDKNGYIDDVHGWNFIGGKVGNVNEDTYELTREYLRLSKVFDTGSTKVSKKQKKQYEDYLKIKDKFQKLKAKNQEEYQQYTNLYRNLRMSVDTLKAVLKVSKLTRDAMDTFRTSNPTLAFAKGFTSSMMKRMGPESDIEEILKELKDATEYYRVIVEYGYNTEFDSRVIIGDNYSNLKERNYGNNDVEGPDAKHGTHVAGIIGADSRSSFAR